MEIGIRHTHLLTVVLFLLIYLIKTVLLLSNNNEKLAKVTKVIKVPEMIISTLFLVTGIYMLTQLPEIKTFLIIKIVMVFISIPIAIIGFKKSNKALATLSLLLIIGAYGMAEMSKKQKSTALESLSETSINGKEIFDISCSPCHGDDGKLGLMGAPDLSVTTFNLKACVEIIKNGKGTMTPFDGALNDEQINSVAEYIETLK